MNIKLKKFVDYINLKYNTDLEEIVDKYLYKRQPEYAIELAIKRLDVFDCDYYYQQYNDIDKNKIDAINHFIRNGINENRNFRLKKVDNNVRAENREILKNKKKQNISKKNAVYECQKLKEYLVFLLDRLENNIK